MIVIENGSVGLWGDRPAWRVEEELRLGSAFGDSTTNFTNLNLSAGLSPRGEIHVLDYTANRVLVFSGGGSFRRIVGRPGRGPGEFNGPTGMAWDALGRMWIADARNRRYTVFDSLGRMVTSFPRQVSGLTRVPHPLGRDADGRIIDELAQRGGIISFVRLDSMGEVLDTVARYQRAPPPRAFDGIVISPSMEAMRFVSSHFVSRTRHALAPDFTIWMAQTTVPQIAQLSPTGDTLRIVRFSRSTALSAADERIIAEGLSEVGLSRNEVTLSRPVIDQLHVLEDGHVLVGIVEEVGEPPNRFDVLTPEGYLLGTLDLGFAMPYRSVPSFVGDTLLGVTLGRFDVPFVVRATIHR